MHGYVPARARRPLPRVGQPTASSIERGVDSIFTFNTQRDEAATVVGLVAEKGQKAVALHLDTGNVTTFDQFVQDALLT